MTDSTDGDLVSGGNVRGAAPGAVAATPTPPRTIGDRLMGMLPGLFTLAMGMLFGIDGRGIINGFLALLDPSVSVGAGADYMFRFVGLVLIIFSVRQVFEGWRRG